MPVIRDLNTFVISFFERIKTVYYISYYNNGFLIFVYNS